METNHVGSAGSMETNHVGSAGSMETNHVGSAGSMETNHVGSAGSMETDGAIKIFQRSVERHGVRYASYYGDKSMVFDM